MVKNSVVCQLMNRADFLHAETILGKRKVTLKIIRGWWEWSEMGEGLYNQEKQVKKSIVFGQ